MQGKCHKCGARAEVLEVEYKQNTGMLFFRRVRVFSGRWCRTCSLSCFRDVMMHSLVLGWWGTISFFVNILFIFENLEMASRARRLAPPRAGSHLDEYRDYALNLLANKEPEIVVEVVAQRAGICEREAQEFIHKIRCLRV